MAEVTINLAGASPYYNEWKREFRTDLEISFPGRVMDQSDEIQVVAGRHSTQIKADKNQDDINVHVISMHQGGGGGAFIGFCLLLMALMLFFGAWRFAFMPFFFFNPFWIIIFFVIIAIPAGGHSHDALIGPISRLARSAWERVMLRNKQSNVAPASVTPVDVHPTSAPAPGPTIAGTPGISMKKAADDGRPPDEEYLLSPAAAEAAATPALVTKVDRDLKSKEGVAMFCPYCGARRQTAAKFCWNCGSALVSQATES